MSLELDFYQMMVQPMRDELTQIGFHELRTSDAVDVALQAKVGTALVVVNSVCGCAGGIARPAVAAALKHVNKPERLLTVFAGQDKVATARAREYFVSMPPSSPSIFLFKDGALVDQLHRSDIEGAYVEDVATRLKSMFDQYCV
ncbi:BrxA/BrxB family bacilliredoxin [Alicyclobacillaceae bacterium I2511]|jgi:putative YphP/YqiW family bacilliredoxin|nr:BrxA/BrxB family bacilliredoxin [Alicyclobacillaceae bacterium I2511]